MSGKRYFEGKSDLLKFDPDKLKLITDPKHPLYDERVHLPVSDALVQSILHAPEGGEPQGVLKPILTRLAGDEVEVIDGRERVKALRAANKILRKSGKPPLVISAVPQRATDVRAMSALVAANVHQPETPVGRALKAKRLLDAKQDAATVAVLLGCSESTVRNLLKLLDAPKAVQAAAESGKITAREAYELARLKPTEARAKLSALKTQAPKTKGKKRKARGAAKARAIVRKGKAAKPGKPHLGGPVAVGAIRSQVEAKIEELECNADDFSRGYVKALRWVLGDDGSKDAEGVEAKPRRTNEAAPHEERA